MEALSLHTGAHRVHWEYNTMCISIVESKRVTTRIKHIIIHACYLQEQIDNGIFITKYEKSSVIPEDMCTKPCACLITSWSIKCMNLFRFYPNSDT